MPAKLEKVVVGSGACPGAPGAAAKADDAPASPPPFKLWKPHRFSHAARSLLLSTNLQLAMQLAVGGVLVSLFTFIECVFCIRFVWGG